MFPEKTKVRGEQDRSCWSDPENREDGQSRYEGQRIVLMDHINSGAESNHRHEDFQSAHLQIMGKQVEDP